MKELNAKECPNTAGGGHNDAICTFKSEKTTWTINLGRGIESSRKGV